MAGRCMPLNRCARTAAAQMWRAAGMLAWAHMTFGSRTLQHVELCKVRIEVPGTSFERSDQPHQLPAPPRTPPSCTPYVCIKLEADVALQNVRLCWHCERVAANMSACRACRNTYFCSAECQRAAWPEHKPYCKKMRQAASNSMDSMILLPLALQVCQPSMLMLLWQLTRLRTPDPSVALAIFDAAVAMLVWHAACALDCQTCVALTVRPSQHACCGVPIVMAPVP